MEISKINEKDILNVMTSSTVIELKGHIIDSLTLAKVIDLIQTAQADYKMNFIDVGYGKNDFSTAHIAISMPDKIQLDKLLSELITYGAKPIENFSASYTACSADGELPKDALLIESSLQRVFINGTWVPLEASDATHTVVVYDAVSQKASLKSQASLKQGELVVTTAEGVPNYLLLK